MTHWSNVLQFYKNILSVLLYYCTRNVINILLTFFFPFFGSNHGLLKWTQEEIKNSKIINNTSSQWNYVLHEMMSRGNFADVSNISSCLGVVSLSVCEQQDALHLGKATWEIRSSLMSQTLRNWMSVIICLCPRSWEMECLWQSALETRTDNHKGNLDHRTFLTLPAKPSGHQKTASPSCTDIHKWELCLVDSALSC